MKISIITINRNNAEGLRKTMKSVLAQTYRDFEYIVVDGASTDNSVGVIKDLLSVSSKNDTNKGECVIDGISIQWLSEPDTGIYSAMNKGIRMANGEYTLMLNSADTLVDEHVIERILPELHNDDIIHGNDISLQDGILYRDKGYAKSNLLFDDVMYCHFSHQASFIKKSLLEELGYYDDSYQKNADSYFYINALGLHNASFRYVDIDICNFDMTGISNSSDKKWRIIDAEEDRRFIKENIPNRLYKYYIESEKKIKLYDNLHRTKFLWKVVMFMSVIARKLYGPLTKIQIERID